LAKVPQYDGPQLQEQALPGARQQEVDVSRNANVLAKGLSDTAFVIDKEIQRADQDAAFSFEAKKKAEWLDYEGRLREARKGRDAHAYDSEVESWWKENAKAGGEALSPGAQRLVGRSMMSSQLQAVAQAKAYRSQQLDQSAAASYVAAQSMAVEEAARAGTPDAVAAALTGINDRAVARGAEQGWSPEQVAAEKLTRSTVLHASVLDTLVKRDPAAAQAYFQRVNAAGEIDARAREGISAKLEQTGALVEGGAAASEVWQAAGPKSLNAPIDMAGMDAKLRQRYANDPARLKAAQSELREMAAAHDKSQSETNAYGVNIVYKQIDAGQPLSKLRLTPEFQSLPGDVQARIAEDVEQRIDRRVRRGADAEQAELARFQRQNSLALLRNQDMYLSLSNPETLAGKTRAEVEALRPTLGLDATQHLLGRWDTLQKPGKMVEAKMDNEDFMRVASDMGLDPFGIDAKNPKDRAEKSQRMGDLKYRVEKVIDAAQGAAKRELTRPEKENLLREEMGRTVNVAGGWFSSDAAVPVIALQPDQLKKVIVPVDATKAITEALAVMRARDPKNPAYAQTDENIRRRYLMNQSKAGALLPAEPKN
jgi:hypothetical protein